MPPREHFERYARSLEWFATTYSPLKPEERDWYHNEAELYAELAYNMKDREDAMKAVTKLFGDEDGTS